tara:strand:- start:54 stop:350 length:297 start_codon:yes stop_codon:yes gene_type:complete
MMSDVKVVPAEVKRWIKPGAEVAHRDFPKRKMIAEEVIKKSQETKNADGRLERKNFTMGVMCHWFNDVGGYERGMFLTLELIPYEVAKKTRKKAAAAA